MSVVNKSTGMKIAHIAKAVKALWHPVSQTNNECTPRMLEIVIVALKRWRAELFDDNNATFLICLCPEMCDRSSTLRKRIRSGRADAMGLMT